MVKEGFYIVVAVLILAVISAIIGYAAPKLTEASNAITDIAAAPKRVDARIANENALAAAQVDALRAQIEISKTNAMIAAEVARKNADAAVAAQQSKARVDELNAQRDLAKVAEDAQTTRNLIAGLLALLIILLIVGGVYLLAPPWFEHRRKAKEIEARQSLMLAAINQAQNGAVVSVALDNHHSFKIEKPMVPASTPQIAAPRVQIDTPSSMQRSTQTSVPIGVWAEVEPHAQ